MAKKQADHAIDLRAELKKRVKIVKVEIVTYTEAQKECVNERAHLLQYYIGCASHAKEELDYLQDLLDA